MAIRMNRLGLICFGLLKRISNWLSVSNQWLIWRSKMSLANNNIIELKPAVPWINEIGQDGWFLARLSDEHCAKRGITKSRLVEIHIMDIEGAARLIRVIENHLGPEIIEWIDPIEFSKEWKCVEIRSYGKKKDG
jgi:hypothetical protein